MIFTKFKELADEKFQNKYEYVESSFEGRFVEIICEEHGTFEKDIYSHLSGVGCKLCNSFNVKLKERVDLVLAANLGFRFVEIEKVKRKTHLVFECSKGHVFRFGKGCETGCSKCSRLGGKKAKIQRLADDNRVEVLISDCSVTTVCIKHGKNIMSFRSFERIKGCKKCKPVNHKYTTDYFKSACRKLKTNYDYSKSVCESCYDVVEIICELHGSFFQKAYSHLAGHKCKKCSIMETQSSYSLAEVEIFGLISGVHGDRSLIYPKELDIYSEEHNLAVEYDGIYWHSTNELEQIDEFKHKHLRKTEMCQRKNTKLLHIFENEWMDERTKRIWVGELLKRTRQIHQTRADYIELLTYETTAEFLKINSFDPQEPGCFNYGLFSSGVLFLVCQFTTVSSNEYFMVKTERFDYKPTTSDVSSLINTFEREHSPGEIVCEIDRRVEFLEDYLEFGFVFQTYTPPKAYLVNNKGKLDEITNSVELQIKTNRIIFDCGTTVMILK